MQRSKSVQIVPPQKSEVSHAIATGLRRAIGTAGGKGTLADTMGCDAKTIDRALTNESIPELHRAFAALLADDTALDEVAALYGFVLRRATAEAANDLETAAGLSHAAGTLIEALADGYRDHRETIAVAKLFRPLVQQMGAIIEDADRLSGTRGAA